MVRARKRLTLVGPVTLAIIVLLLYLNFRRSAEVAIIMGTLPMALIGGMVSATVLTLVVIPALFLIWRGRMLECMVLYRQAVDSSSGHRKIFRQGERL